MKNNATLESLSSKSGNPFDKAFVKAMVIHHNEAMAMATLALKRSNRKAILKLAKKIISAQSKENEQMEEWKSEWK